VGTATYPGVIPKLWHETIKAHRREVHDAILDTAAALVAQHGLRSVTMSQIAHETGIGRATLYKYFSGVEPILVAWHERHVAAHLEHLTQLRNQPGDAGQRLESVLEAFALITYERHQQGTELAAVVHQGERMASPGQRLLRIIRDMLAEAVDAHAVRDDVPPDELANFCVHALAAAGSLQSKVGVRRLVTVTLAALRRTSATRPGGPGF
jgi:AcrR family transcriptional regulator